MTAAGPRNYQVLAEALASRMGADADSTTKALESGGTRGGQSVETTAQEPVERPQPFAEANLCLAHVGSADEVRR